MAVSKEVRGLAMHDTQPEGEYPIGEGKDQVSPRDIENQDRRPSRIPLRLRKFISWIALFTALGTFAEARRAGAQGPDIEPTKTPAAAAVVPTSPGGESDSSIVRIEDVGLIPIPDNNKEFKDAAAKAPKSVIRVENGKAVTVKVAKIVIYRDQLVGVDEKGNILEIYFPNLEHAFEGEWFNLALECSNCVIPLRVYISQDLNNKKSLPSLNTYIRSVGGPTQYINPNDKKIKNVIGYRFTNSSDIQTLTDESEKITEKYRLGGAEPDPIHKTVPSGENGGQVLYDDGIVYTVATLLHRTDYDNVRQELKEGKINQEFELPNGQKWNPKKGFTIIMTRAPSDKSIGEMSRKKTWYVDDVPGGDMQVDPKTGRLVITMWNLYGYENLSQQLTFALSSIIKANGGQVKTMGPIYDNQYYYDDDRLNSMSSYPFGDKRWLFWAMIPIYAP